jgi:hypothetical protein
VAYEKGETYLILCYDDEITARLSESHGTGTSNTKPYTYHVKSKPTNIQLSGLSPGEVIRNQGESVIPVPATNTNLPKMPVTQMAILFQGLPDMPV